MARATPRIHSEILLLPGQPTDPIEVGTPAWFAWLEAATTFAFADAAGSFTARKERSGRSGAYWKAYRRDNTVDMPLLAAKLRVPDASAELIARAPLVDRLNLGLRGRLTLLSAPAGFGKTTLLVQGLGAGSWGLGSANPNPQILAPSSYLPLGGLALAGCRG